MTIKLLCNRAESLCIDQTCRHRKPHAVNWWCEPERTTPCDTSKSADGRHCLEHGHIKCRCEVVEEA